VWTAASFDAAATADYSLFASWVCIVMEMTALFCKRSTLRV